MMQSLEKDEVMPLGSSKKIRGEGSLGIDEVKKVLLPLRC